MRLRAKISRELVPRIQNLQDFSELLCSLPVGKSATLPLSVYELLFPPGEPDQGARGRAGDFAQEHGCEIRNPTAGGEVLEVVFIKRVTHPPAWRAADLRRPRLPC
jgi:hypothetical protein